MSTKVWMTLNSVVLIVIALFSFFGWIFEIPIWAGIIILALGILPFFAKKKEGKEE